jgi:hypothetical protein
MADGFISQAQITQYTNTAVHTVTAGRYAEFSVALFNTTTQPINASIAIGANTNPANVNYINQGITIPAKAVWERTGLVANASKKIVVITTANGVNASVYGLETPAT